MLTLVSVTPFWAVALKLVRYTKWDPGDICLLLRSVLILLAHPHVLPDYVNVIFSRSTVSGSMNLEAIMG
jgi:hypothetical protein